VRIRNRRRCRSGSVTCQVCGKVGLHSGGERRGGIPATSMIWIDMLIFSNFQHHPSLKAANVQILELNLKNWTS
jgi:hypothetical protein